MAAPREPASSRDWVLVPVKAFGDAKARLGSVLTPTERAALATTMASRVLRAAAPLPVCVACDDLEVARFAEHHGASVIWTPGLGLNGAVERGVTELAQRGAAYVTVVHADLPTAIGIGMLESFNGVTVAPDRARRGTNLLRVPTHVGFRMQFGRGSLDRHLAECARLRLDCLVLHRDDLAFDVDEPSDLALLGTQNGGTP